MKKQRFMALFALLGVLVLILDSETALGGARNGIALCVQVVIPSLFPFFVLINLLNHATIMSDLSWLSPLERLLNIPRGSASIWLCGILGGYPTGAQLVHRAWRDQTVSEDAANRMLMFCSNAGPAFLFGIIAAQFENGAVAWSIWAIHILSSLAVARAMPVDTQERMTKKNSAPLTLSDALKKAVSVTGQVCGWIVLFRVVVAFCIRWFLWVFPNALQALFICLLELANGASFLREIENEGLRMLITTAGVNFGGLCVLMQTSSVTDGLKLSSYLKGKLMQTGIGVVLAMIAQRFLFSPSKRINIDLIWVAAVFVFVTALTYFLRKRKITVAFRRKPLYNLINHERKG